MQETCGKTMSTPQVDAESIVQRVRRKPLETIPVPAHQGPFNDLLEQHRERILHQRLEGLEVARA